MSKLIIITGLTGSGKSSLAIDVAKKHNGEIISADSVQIYKGLDIGSAKVTKKDMQGITHHLIDIKNFNENYSVGDFVKDCENAVNNIVARGKLPIIVGGTGLYIKAIINGYTLGESSNLEFRHALEKEAKEYGNIYVWEKLNKLNPEKAQTVHPNNLKRVIRYIELEKNPSNGLTNSFISKFDVCLIGLTEDREDIYNKINIRVDNLINMGLEQEIKNLISCGATKEMQSMSAIGYKEWFDYFSGNSSYNTTIDLIKQHTRNYCKRQLTFMKTIEGLIMCDKGAAKRRIEEFLSN